MEKMVLRVSKIGCAIDFGIQKQARPLCTRVYTKYPSRTGTLQKAPKQNTFQAIYLHKSYD